MNRLSKTIKQWATTLKKEILTLWFCQKHADMPLIAKLMAIFIVTYAFSPIDLIPDFIPILGYLDDVIIVPIGIYFTLKLIPQHVIADARWRANDWMTQHNKKPKNWFGAGIILLIWLFLAYQLSSRFIV